MSRRRQLATQYYDAGYLDVLSVIWRGYPYVPPLAARGRRTQIATLLPRPKKP